MIKELYQRQIEQALRYKQELDEAKKSWQDVFHNINVKNAQSWNAETNKKYRHGFPGNSALVKTIKYDDKNHRLIVTYRNGFTARYENISSDDVSEFINSDSKGRWALKHLWDKEYSKV